MTILQVFFVGRKFTCCCVPARHKKRRQQKQQQQSLKEGRNRWLATRARCGKEITTKFQTKCTGLLLCLLLHHPITLLLSSKFVKRTPIYGHKINQAASLRKKTNKGCQERKTKRERICNIPLQLSSTIYL